MSRQRDLPRFPPPQQPPSSVPSCSDGGGERCESKAEEMLPHGKWQGGEGGEGSHTGIRVPEKVSALPPPGDDTAMCGACPGLGDGGGERPAWPAGGSCGVPWSSGWQRGVGWPLALPVFPGPLCGLCSAGSAQQLLLARAPPGQPLAPFLSLLEGQWRPRGACQPAPPPAISPVPPHTFVSGTWVGAAAPMVQAGGRGRQAPHGSLSGRAAHEGRSRRAL